MPLKVSFICLFFFLLAACNGLTVPSTQTEQLLEDSENAKEEGLAEGDWPTYLPDGQPNIEGLWRHEGGTSGLNIEALPNSMETGRTMPTMIVDPPSGILPYHPWARKRRDEVLNNYNHPNHAQVDQRNRGWPDGVPRLNYYSHLIQVLQPPGYVIMLYEVQHEFRIIPLDRRSHPNTKIKLWMGDSRGHWEGNTLVVDVTNHNDSTRFAVTGDFHSDEMQLTERWEFVDAETIEYVATINDPQVYTDPWSLGVTIKRDTLEGNEVLEYAGVEGEKDVDLMVDIPKAVENQKKPQ